MAKLGCRCGCALSNSVCPSPNIIEVFTKESVDKGISEGIKLYDYDSNYDDGYEYWICRKCLRVYKVPNGVNESAESVYVRVTNLVDSLPKESQEIFIYTEMEIDAALEENEYLTLKQFVNDIPRSCKFYTDEKSSSIYAVDTATGQILYKYVEE